MYSLVLIIEHFYFSKNWRAKFSFSQVPIGILCVLCSQILLFAFVALDLVLSHCRTMTGQCHCHFTRDSAFSTATATVAPSVVSIDLLF